MLRLRSTQGDNSATVKLRIRSMEQEQYNVIGPQVRTLREAAGLDQATVVARCGALGWHLSRGTLAKIESRRRAVVDAEVFILAKALRIPIPALYPSGLPTILAAVRQADL